MSNKRFYQYQASLRNYLRRRGALIDTKLRTILIDPEELNRKEYYRLQELLKYGYSLISEEHTAEVVITDYTEGESFIAFADEIMAYYK